MHITATPSPRGTFYTARHGNLAAFDRNRGIAIRKLIEAIWRVNGAAANQGAA